MNQVVGLAESAADGHCDADSSSPGALVKRTAPRVKVDYDEDNPDAPPEVSTYHKDPQVGYQQLMAAMGISDVDIFNQTMSHLGNLAAIDGEVDEEKFNQLVSSVKSVEPRDQMESMLACQMSAIHDATMAMAGSLRRAEYVSTRSESERSLNRLARTFSMQMETLKKYRDDRTQKILVQHVNVEPGGQAVVGTINKGGGESNNKTDATP